MKILNLIKSIFHIHKWGYTTKQDFLVFDETYTKKCLKCNKVVKETPRLSMYP